jgi:hypothetical protein
MIHALAEAARSTRSATDAHNISWNTWRGFAEPSENPSRDCYINKWLRPVGVAGREKK